MRARTAVGRLDPVPADVPAATLPAEQRGRGRDDVRLLVTTPDGHRDRHFRELPDALEPGDLLVVNDSATLAASLPARNDLGTLRLHLCTRYGARLWLAEPRRSEAEPGPLPLEPGSAAVAGDSTPVRVRFIAPHPGLPRLWFVASDAALEPSLAADGTPIRYAYLERPQPLEAYQSIFARVPGSAEMPSAARPFTEEMVAALAARDIGVTAVTLHAGVSSLELPADGSAPLYAEPFEVGSAAAARIEAVRRAGGRIVAVGTTVVRALETAVRREGMRPARGFTRRFVRPGDVHGAVDGLLTGFHEPASSHLALLAAVAGATLVEAAYAAAIQRGYLWHEFGDVHLILP